MHKDASSSVSAFGCAGGEAAWQAAYGGEVGGSLAVPG